MAYEKTEYHDEYLKAAEQYEDYEAGTWESMTLREKMDFFDGVHTDRIPLFDEDGDDMDTADDYYAIRDDFLERPEQFSLDHISDFIKMLDDECYQPSFMDTVVKIIHKIACYYKVEGIIYLLSHLGEVPNRGYEYGLFWNVRYLIKDDLSYPFVKEALMQISPNDSEFVLQILDGTNIPEILGIDSKTKKFPVLSECGDKIELIRKSELENMISHILKGEKL